MLESKPQEIPSRVKINQRFRSFIDPIIGSLPLPRFNVDYITASSLLMSIIFVFLFDRYFSLAIVILFLMLFLDGLDGVLSRKFYPKQSNSIEGWLKDHVADRLAHGIIAIKFFTPFFYLFIIDLILIFFSIKIKKQYVIPYHFVFLIYFLFLY